jgi:hypothetical protein
MRLKSIKFCEFGATDQGWFLDNLLLGHSNLLVGKNATGKTRTLNVISNLARFLANERKAGLSSDYDVLFEHDGQELRYVLKIEDDKVEAERFWVDGLLRLDRGDQGAGEIFAEQIDNGKMVRFQTPQNELAAVARQDAIQHTFLKPLSDWGKSLRHFYFGSSLGKDNYVIFVETGGMYFNEKDVDAAVIFFHKSIKDYGEPFKQQLIEDMGRLGYPLENIELQPPLSVRLKDSPPGEPRCLTVKEVGLKGFTDQYSMSQGMFRALAILIHLAYSQFAKKATCILIDDIGEGLDFDRSCRLIELLRERARETGSQLVLSTNDRFVMNNVPLEEWSVLQRRGSHVCALNAENSRALFEDFKFTGLSNFSFLEMDFAAEPSKEEASCRD